MTEQTSDIQNLYTSLDELVGARFHVKHRTLGSQQKVMQQVSGGHHSLRKGSGMTFSEVRQYHAGDDIRHIDWRVTARTQKAHTKVFTEEHEKPVVIVAEQTPAMFFGSQVQLKASQALNVAALLGWCTLQQNDLIGGMVFNDHQQTWVASKRQQQTLLSWFNKALVLQHSLNQPGSTNPQYWQQACQQLLKVVKPGSKVFLIGDFLNLSDIAQNQLKSLRKHSDITAIHIYDPLEKNLPKLGWLSLTAGWVSDTVLPLNSLKKETRQQYNQQYQQAWSQTQQSFREMQIPIIEVSTTDSAAETLIKQRIIK
ncbi:MAG: DUF58 domain-containing protein [Pseudomonadota bacterium]|nr:DUF58 domain-containing protein [Pseudomonadota bacterium]